jgi:type IV secretory pathway VirJ component
MRGIRRFVTGLAAVMVAAAAFMAWLGYFGGPLFTDVPIRTPAERARFAVVFLSSDVGFNTGIGPDIAARLAADGVPVVGVNMLTYLRRTRTPAEITALIARAEQRALRLGHTDRVVLIGLSFGADMLHIGLVDLPASLRAKVAKVALIVPEDTVQFRASPNEIFDYWTPTVDAMPTARQLTWAPLLCIHGSEEAASLCPLLKQPNARVMALPGGHPLHRDADALYATVSQFVFAH